MRKFIYLCLALLLSGCGNSGGGGTPAISKNQTSNLANWQLAISIAELAPIPIVNGQAQGVNLLVRNNSSVALSLTKLEVSVNNTVTDAAEFGFNGAACNSIPVQGTCNIDIPPRTFDLHSAKLYVVIAQFKGSDGNNYSLSQQINYQTNSSVYNGIYVSRAPLKIMVAPNNTSALVIPFVLNQSFESITVVSTSTSGNVTTMCSSGYQSGSSCSAIIPVQGGQYNSTIKIIGTTSAGVMTNMLPFTVSSNQLANIVTSVNAFIQQESSGSGTTQVTLYNNGLAPASIGSINSGNADIVINSQGCTVVNAGNFCTIVLNSSAWQNISTTVTVNYTTQNSANNQSTQFSLNYYTNSISTQPQIEVAVDNPNMFTNILVNNSESYGPLTITYTNIGNTTLSNLAIPTGLMNVYPNLSIKLVGNDCANGQSLNKGQSCNVGLFYSALKVESWSQLFALTGQYNNPASPGHELIPFTTDSQIITVDVLPEVEFLNILTTDAVYNATIDSQTGYLDNNVLYSLQMQPGITNADMITDPLGKYVYILQAQEDTTMISSYKIDLTKSEFGYLLVNSSISLDNGYPYSITIDKSGKYMYAVTRDHATGSNQLSIDIYQVESGNLKLLSSPIAVNFGTNTSCASESSTVNMTTITPDNKYLYVACTSGNSTAAVNLAGFAVNADGTINQIAGVNNLPYISNASVHARGIKTDSVGNSLYVLLNNGEYNFNINQSNGSLEIESSFAESSTAVNLTDFVLDPSNKNAYFTNSIMQYGVNVYQKIFMTGINAVTGNLFLLNPPSITSSLSATATASIGIEPLGNYVYSVILSGSYQFVLIFMRDKTSGQLTSISDSKTSPFMTYKTPIKLNIFMAKGD